VKDHDVTVVRRRRRRALIAARTAAAKKVPVGSGMIAAFEVKVTEKLSMPLFTAKNGLPKT
jgi:hypothetical protein